LRLPSTDLLCCLQSIVFELRWEFVLTCTRQTPCFSFQMYYTNFVTTQQVGKQTKTLSGPQPLLFPSAFAGVHPAGDHNHLLFATAGFRLPYFPLAPLTRPQLTQSRCFFAHPTEQRLFFWTECLPAGFHQTPPNLLSVYRRCMASRRSFRLLF